MSKQTNKFFYRLETVSLLIEICYWTYKNWRMDRKIAKYKKQITKLEQEVNGG